MYAFWNKLFEFCRQSPLTKKILVMPSLLSGATLLRSFNLKGYAYLNLQAATIQGLVTEQMETYLYRQGVQVVSKVPAECRVYEIMEDFNNKDSFAYFNRMEITPSVAALVWQALMELKQAGYKPDNMDTAYFVNPAKGEDLCLVYNAYEEKLRRDKLVDHADLLLWYLEEIPPEVAENGECRLLVPENLRVTKLERSILDRWLAAGQEKIGMDYLPLPKVLHPQPPADCYRVEQAGSGSGEAGAESASSVANYPTSKLAAAFSYEPYYKSGQEREDEEEASADPQAEAVAPAAPADEEASRSAYGRAQVDFFHAYGESAEVREILRTIKSERLNFEDVVIYCTEQDVYNRLFWEEGRRCGIPITFGDGVSIESFRPGRLLAGIMEWIRQDYAVSVLYPLLSGESFRFNGGSPGKMAVARELRSSPIGWSRERYQEWINEVDAEFAEATAAEEELNYKYLVHWALKEVLAEILNKIPVPDANGKVDSSNLARGLAELVEERGAVAGEGDARTGNMIADILRELNNAGIGETTLEEALEWIERAVMSLRVARSLPEAGSIHVAGYRCGIWTCRPHVFVAGLDVRRFPGQGIEDPVLLDNEREKLGDLPRVGERPAENIYEMLQLLAARESDSSRITLSFASYDTVEKREASPSSLLLQVYRVSTGHTSASYGDFMASLGPPRGIVPVAEEGSLGEDGWWMHCILRKKETRNLSEKVKQVYPALFGGWEAIEKRREPVFTVHDGLIYLQEPLWEDGMSMSASRLEKLAQCPYSYFVEHVLRISPPEEIAYDPTAWLDDPQRGSLLHRIYEEFYRELLQRGERPDYDTHWGLLEELAWRCVNETKEELPPSHEVVYQRESEEILESCDFFLRAETQNQKLGYPTYLELTFGIEGTKSAELDEEAPPVQIELPSSHYFYLRGKIDRVDYREDSNDYLVLDYKTGSTSVFDSQDNFRGGRRLQHILYGLALKKTLQEQGITPNPVIGGCGYYFPTSRGRGQLLVNDYNTSLDDFYWIMEFLRKILASGFFLMTNHPDEDCTICDYSSICDISTFGEAVQQKMEASEERIPVLFREIREIK